MIRVAIVLEDFSIGGAQRVVSELVQHIDAKKVKLLVLCLWERSDTALAEAAEKVADVRYLGIHGKNLIANYFRISKILRSFHPDIVHAHLVGQLYAVPWGLLNHVPVLITAHTKPRKAFIKKIEWLIHYGVNHLLDSEDLRTIFNSMLGKGELGYDRLLFSGSSLVYTVFV